jgi:hypothetical protein
MAGQGNASAVRERLRSARREFPVHSAALQRLQASADQFDFQTMIDHLQEAGHELRD